MIINGAWYLDSLPTCAVVEKADGSLAKFFINPFREITENELSVYKGYHPRKCNGQPLPLYLYKFYGLAKNDEVSSEVIHVRLTPTEKKRLQEKASEQGKTVTELIKDVVKE